MRKTVSAFAFALLGLGAIACGSPTDPADEAVAESEDDLTKAIKITEKDDGATVNVAAGRSFSIALGSNPTTGYDWSVTSVDAALGKPYKEKFSAAKGGAVGSGGTQSFYWSGKATDGLVGDFKIDLAYARSWEKKAPAETFSVTIHIPPAPGGMCGGFAGLTCPKGQTCVDDTADSCDPKKGGADCPGKCVIENPTPPDDCRTKGCSGNATCSPCWGKFACLPKGALC